MSLFRVLTDLVRVEEWFKERAPALQLKTEVVLLGKTDGWGFARSVPGDGPVETAGIVDVSRQDGKFFRVVGAEITRRVGEKTQRWGQPLFAGSKPGFVAFLRERETGMFLVQLLAEPGNKGFRADGENTRVLAASTFQASPDNLDRAVSAIASGGAVPPAVVRYLPLARLAYTVAPNWPPVCEDGGRFFEKCNHYGLVEDVDLAHAEQFMEDAAPDAQDFAWVPEDVLKAMAKNGFLNSHAVQAYGMSHALRT